MGDGRLLLPASRPGLVRAAPASGTRGTPTVTRSERVTAPATSCCDVMLTDHMAGHGTTDCIRRLRNGNFGRTEILVASGGMGIVCNGCHSRDRTCGALGQLRAGRTFASN